jgi:hypothetical protein
MWEPQWQEKYTGSHGQPKAGPTQFITNIVRSAKGLCEIIVAILPLAFFEQVTQLTEKYCYDDWVVERRKNDSNGNKMVAVYFVPVSSLTDGAPTPNRCRQVDKKQVQYQQDSSSHVLGFLYFKVCILVLRRGQHKNVAECTVWTITSVCSEFNDTRCV